MTKLLNTNFSVELTTLCYQICERNYIFTRCNLARSCPHWCQKSKLIKSWKLSFCRLWHQWTRFYSVVGYWDIGFIVWWDIGILVLLYNAAGCWW